MSHPERTRWFHYPVVLRPGRIAKTLQAISEAELVATTPTLWQICVGVIRMWHRMLFRAETVGVCEDQAVRRNWRARLLQYRPVRFPFLWWHGSVAPFDLSGLVSTPKRITTHLLGTHHDKNQFVYDMQMLQVHPGALEALAEQARRVLTVDDRHSRWLKDLCVYEGYHESLLACVEAGLESGFQLPEADARNPDVSFFAYLDWCAQQPTTPRETWRALRAGRLQLDQVVMP